MYIFKKKVSQNAINHFHFCYYTFSNEGHINNMEKIITKTPTMLGMEDMIPVGKVKGKFVKELVKQKDLVKKKEMT